MTRLSFDSVDALIYDPVAANRTSTRSALYALGFRKTESVATLDTFVEAMNRRPPDLALCEAQGVDEELCKTIQQFRQGVSGYNPFIVIIVTAWEKNNALINRVVSSGADDLLLRPFSTALLGSRIETHIERRKGFVVTSEYVGPDRRSNSARAGNAPLFEPPNSLKMKAKDKLPPETIAKVLDNELKAARETMSLEKLRRNSFQICVLWRLMQEERAQDGKRTGDLGKLHDLTKSVGRRCRDGDDPSAVEWCDSILAAAEGLRVGVDRNASMHLLGHAALSLHQTFHPEKSPADQLAEIDATVALIRARTQTEALAG